MIKISDILCSRRREQDESHSPHFIFHCKLSKTAVDFISGLINVKYTFDIYAFHI